MKKIKKILVPTDFSVTASKAYHFAQKLAKKFNASIEVLHVYRTDIGMPMPETVAYELLEARKEDGLKKMEIFLRKADKSLHIEHFVEMGFPSDLIADYTKNKAAGIDLIVMGTKGEHSLADKILGSVSTAVIRDAACPVLAVPENFKEIEIKVIAFASDLNEDNSKSLPVAAEIAKLFKSEVHCVNVDIFGDDNSAEKKKFKDLLSKLKLEIDLKEISSDTVNHGLETYVHENGIDMLLMYHPQRNFFERIFHNSTTRKVALNSTVPLLVFK